MKGIAGVCAICKHPVQWYRRAWREPTGARNQVPKVHVCPVDRPACGAWMPHARERCARRPGHGYEHRSLFAMQTQRKAWAAA